MSDRIWFRCIPVHNPLDGNGLPKIQIAWVKRDYLQINSPERLPARIDVRTYNHNFFSRDLDEGVYDILGPLDDTVATVLEVAYGLDVTLRGRLVEQIDRIANETLWHAREWQKREDAKWKKGCA